MKTTPLGAAALLAMAAVACHKVAADGTGDGAAAAERVDGDQVLLAPDSARLAVFAVAPVSPVAPEAAHLNGRLAWNEDVTVRVFSPFAGRVVSVLSDAGKAVRQGDTLALIASPDFGQAQADARRAATDLALAERTLARTRDLYEHGAVAQKDVYGAEADVARARAESQRATSRLSLYGADSASVSQVFALRAPLGGTVVERNVTPGQEVRPDQMLASAPQLFAPLFVVTDPARLWVQIDVPERDLAPVRPGAALAIRTQAWPDRVFHGTVTLVGSAVDPATRTVKVRGVVDNPGGLLKAEMLITADAGGRTPDLLAVPVSAVLLESDGHVVYVAETRGRFRRAVVTVGPAQAGMLPVTSGLRAGDTVVTSGSLLLEQLFEQHAHS